MILAKQSKTVSENTAKAEAVFKSLEHPFKGDYVISLNVFIISFAFND